MLKLVIGNKNYSSWSMRPWVLLRQAGILTDEEGLYAAQNLSVVHHLNAALRAHATAKCGQRACRVGSRCWRRKLRS